MPPDLPDLQNLQTTSPTYMYERSPTRKTINFEVPDTMCNTKQPLQTHSLNPLKDMQLGIKILPVDNRQYLNDHF